MQIIKFEYYNEENLIENLRRVHIMGRPELKIYRDAKIYIKENLDPEEILFAQYYVLQKDLDEIELTRNQLLQFGVDIFKLKGFVRVFYRDDIKYSVNVFDVLPPVVELSQADGGIPLLNDGMHRLYLARKAKSKINIVIVEGVDEKYPYYALPNFDGWNNLQCCIEPPDIKKNYRIKEYKTLFRDFNSAFINVTQVRTDKKPAELQVAGKKVKV